MESFKKFSIQKKTGKEGGKSKSRWDKQKQIARWEI